MADLESITVLTDQAAKVVLDEKFGTVVAGNNVKILPASITHGNLNITIRSGLDYFTARSVIQWDNTGI